MRHPINRALVYVAGVAGIFASIPLSLSGLALVWTLGLGVEVLAALVVTSLPNFRAWVDRRHHQEALEYRRKILIEELSGMGESHALATYQHMVERVQALEQTLGDQRITLARSDVDRLEGLAVDYLSLCVAHASMRHRKESLAEGDVVRRIERIESQLGDSALSEEESRQLRATLGEYNEALKRSRRLAVRASALEATLLAMPDKIEEVYQLVITSPYATDMGGKLADSLSRLRFAEEVAAEFELSDRPVSAAPKTQAVGAPNRLAQVVGQRQKT